ncbi:phosphoadenosine phosphosulfate reductase [Muricauda sp. MAR_2010_75]|uniref:phosphoadenosine phosphosulfate reductase n=1 Tax=Allomuricauda sp. MAR_2010_75 TaxID=1250232 RepID=UPI001E4276F7|nr:phosphoadenosine phosphosulfate reductase [Muricauda sp. MAR_2010_75]
MVDHWGIPLVLIEGLYSNELGVGVSYKIVDFENLDMSSGPFTGAIEQLNKIKWTGVPNQATPYCSSYLKTRPIHKFATDVFGTPNYIKAIGYRFEDMPKRITISALEQKTDLIAPLLTDFEQPIPLRELNRFWNNQPFKLKINSNYGNCQLCWKKSEKNLIKSIRYGVDCIDWYRDMERKYDNRFFRNNLSIDDLISMASITNQIEVFSDEGESCFCGI